MNPTPPQATIVLPVRLASHTIKATVESLLSQQCADSFEIVAAVHREDPAAPWLRRHADSRLRVIESTAPAAGIPQLRRDAALAARGQLLALAEDHCIYPADWLATLSAAANSGGGEHVVSGGSIANGRRSYAGWAQYFTRYSAFLPPPKQGPASHLPGNNACYPATAVLARREHLTEGFWEAEFNDLLRRDGFLLQMTGSVVTQRQHRGLVGYFTLRYRHGRCYGGRRMATTPPRERFRLWLRAPLIPAVLFARTARAVTQSPSAAEFRFVSPLVLAYQLAWSAGEIAGYLAGPGNSLHNTD